MPTPEGKIPHSPEAVAQFWNAALAKLPTLSPTTRYAVRCIGLDAATTRQIFDLIRARDKTGTFALPWVHAATGEPVPQPGDCFVLVDWDGTPTLIVRITRVQEATFGKVREEDIAVDGSPVRSLDVWVPLHTEYWNAMLRPYGRTVTPDMPFWVQAFELIYDAGTPARG